LEIASSPVSDDPPLAKDLQQDVDGAEAQQRAAVAHRERARRVDRVVVRQVSDHLSHQASDDHHHHAGREEVRREGECPPGLAQPAKVDEEEDQHHTDGDLQAVVHQPRNRRGDGVGPGGGLHSHGDDVVDHQRDGSHLGDHRAEVLPRHDVRAPSLRVEHDNLPVTQGHQHQDDKNDQRHRQKQGVCREPERR